MRLANPKSAWPKRKARRANESFFIEAAALTSCMADSAMKAGLPKAARTISIEQSSAGTDPLYDPFLL